MIRILVYFENPASLELIELKGLSKRINAIGLQPIPGDRFKYEDLGKEDKEAMDFARPSETMSLIVKSRQFKFENTYAAIYIKLVTN